MFIKKKDYNKLVERVEDAEIKIEDMKKKLNFIADELGYDQTREEHYRGFYGWTKESTSTKLIKWEKLLEKLGLKWKEGEKMPACFEDVKKFKRK